MRDDKWCFPLQTHYKHKNKIETTNRQNRAGCCNPRYWWPITGDHSYRDILTRNPVTSVMMETMWTTMVSLFSNNIISNQLIAHIPHFLNVVNNHIVHMNFYLFVLGHIFDCKTLQPFFPRGKNTSFRDSDISSNTVDVTSNFPVLFIISNKRKVLISKSIPYHVCNLSYRFCWIIP